MKHIIVFFVFTVSVCFIHGQISSNSCPDSLKACLCGYIDKQTQSTFITNCTNSNITDAKVLQDIPERTKILIFNGNNIPELPPNVFGLPEGSVKKHETLEVIDLSNNFIRKVHGKSFHMVSNVKKLNLSDNQIHITRKEYHPRFFSNFAKLEELYLDNAFGDLDRSDNFVEDLISMISEAKPTQLKVLSLKHNSIQDIPNPMAFAQLSLQKLFLGHNELSTMNMDLTSHPKLRLLDLSHNQITTVTNETLDQLKNLSRSFHLNLSGNPFNCDCTLYDFFNWLRTTSMFVVNIRDYRCGSGYPKSNTDKILLSLTPSDFQCDYFIAGRHGLISATYFILILMVIICSTILIGVIYQHRLVLYSHCSKSWSQVVSKSQYTSLERDERNRNQQVEEVAV